MTPGHASSRDDQCSPPEGGGHVRVVLLGCTGLDASLREDSSIEMVRARTPLEVVGEVASPPASARSLPTVVVVGREGEPAEQSEFVSAIREADPSVKLIRVADGANGGAGVGTYDAVLDESGVSPESIRSVLDPASRGSDFDLLDPVGRVVEAGRRSGLQLRPVESGPPLVIPKAKPADSACGCSVPGDLRLLEAISSEREVFVRSALDLILERTGASDLELVDADTFADEEVAVVPGKKRYGALRSTEIGREDLAAHAAWLGAWLSHHEHQQSLRRAAFTDPLTGAWNRRYFDGFLASALHRARSARRTVTVLVFDIDGFKQYNDRFGHPAGDEILIETVRALKSSVRPSDRVCRIGGDEFAVIFDEPDGPRGAGSRPPESVYVLAKRVQRQIAERKFPKLGSDAPGELTISGGLAAFPWDGHDADTLLCKADELACQSKRQGKNAIMLGPGAERVCRGADCQE